MSRQASRIVPLNPTQGRIVLVILLFLLELPAGIFAGLTERIEKTATILIVVEDGFAPVPAIHQMVNGSRKLDAQRSRHGTAEDTSDFHDCQSLEPLTLPSNYLASGWIGTSWKPSALAFLER